MADAQVEILIKAIDESSKVLNDIQAKVNNLAKDSEKQTQSLNKSFESTTNGLLALGNTANSVNNIFDTFQNTQIRLENATDRFENAQVNLARAQRNLIKIQKDNTSSSDDLLTAQEDLARATRQLETSQRNLDRIQGDVIKSYINIGVQVVSLIGSLPMLVRNIQSLTASSWAFVASPVGLVLGAVALAIGTVILLWKNWEKLMDNSISKVAVLITPLGQLVYSIKKITEVLKEYNIISPNVNSEIKSYTELQQQALDVEKDRINAINGIYDAMLGKVRTEKGTPELENDRKIAESKLRLAELNNNLMRDDNANASRYLNERILAEQRTLDQLRTKKELFDAERTLKETTLIVKQQQEREVDKINLMSVEAQKQTAYMTTGEILKSVNDEIITKERELQGVLDATNQQLERRRSVLSKILGSGSDGGASKSSSSKTPTAKETSAGMSLVKRNDFLMRPGQPSVSFSPDDTIIGVKNTASLGKTINVYINSVMGTNSNEIARALKIQLRDLVNV